MKSIKNLYRIGKGPSSSHSMGPQFAAQRFLEENKGAKSFSVTLYGSLAKTGKGHGTDVVLKSVLYAESVSKLMKIPVVMTTVSAELFPKLQGKIENLFPLELQKKL